MNSKIKSSKTDETLFINDSLTENQISQLIHYSNNDSEILKNTSDKIRFADKETFIQRLNTKKRTYFSLRDEEENLAGIFWTGEKQMPEFTNNSNHDLKKYALTFAIRIYDRFRGKGFAVPFLKEGIKMFKETEEYSEIKNNKFWLVTKKENQSSKKVYSEVGFIEIGEIEGNGQVVMILKN